MFDGLLTSVVFLPAAGALLIAALVRGDRNVRVAALAIIVADLALAIWVMGRYDSGVGGFQMIDRFSWIPNDLNFNADYHLGVDGLSAPLVLLTAFIGLCAVLASWRVQLRVREYFVWMLVLQTSVLGVFTALDFLLFFLFWELELLPMFLLISIWGSGRKEYSAMKFLVFTLLGSAFMLVSIIAIFASSGVNTFNMLELSQMGVDGQALAIPTAFVFWFFFVAFAVKLPAWPLHSWLPDAHTDAPTAGSMWLAGVLLKMGGYGIIRVCIGMFPTLADQYAWILVTIAVVSVIYAAVVTLRQTDLKRLIAFSSVSHMGLVLLGAAAVGLDGVKVPTAGLTGAAMQMFTHGTITALLFLVVGLLYEKAHTRYIPDLGGLASRMPILASAFVLAGLASLGLPGLSGFVSEVLVFLGSFKAFLWPTALAAFGIVLAAAYILWMIERVLFGQTRDRFAQVRDADWVEALPVALLVASIVVIGVYPRLLTDVFDSGTAPLAALFG